MRWPGRIPPGQVLNGIVSLEDVVPTIMAAAGVPDVKEQLLQGYEAGDKHFRVHLDGYNQLPYFKGETDESLRDEFFYYGEHELYAIRYRNWKVHFQVKDDWFAGQSMRPTVPRPVNLRVDPFEQHMDAPYYPFYVGEKLWTIMPGRLHSSAARGDVRGVPASSGSGELQSSGDAGLGAERRSQGHRQHLGEQSTLRSRWESRIRRR
jgi:arylsulfatase A-like enzyme